ncbi:MAG TPA: methylated-DNA--[protein]-cysteine S-methyltransferase [Gammaproteobacteria bacterium]
MAESKQTFDAVMPVPFGAIGIRMRDDVVTAIELIAAKRRASAPRTPAARAAVRALERYFQNPRNVPDMPVMLDGTPFQRRVWQALRAISPGETVTYGALAAALATSARAVGGACRANPVPIIVPCHRVVAAHGAGGFMGATRGRALSIKTWLLGHEGLKDGGGQY